MIKTFTDNELKELIEKQVEDNQDPIEIIRTLDKLYTQNIEVWFNYLDEIDFKEFDVPNLNLELAVEFKQRFSQYKTSKFHKNKQQDLYNIIQKIKEANQILFKYLENEYKQEFENIYVKFGNRLISSGTKLISKVKNYEIYHKFSDNLSQQELDMAIVLIVLGETGSGKTTLLNAMTTYLMGINFEDKVRFQIIKEELKENSQTVSQTSDVNTYMLKSRYFERPVIFIDTPGFGDTKGYEADMQIQKKLFTFLNDSKFKIHGICFVMKASSNRLTQQQIYVAQNVLTFFGKDAAENIVGMYTFADYKIPLAREAAIKAGVPIQKDFKFNNSAIFPCVDEDYNDELIPIYWDMGYKSLDSFFSNLQLKNSIVERYLSEH